MLPHVAKGDNTMQVIIAGSRSIDIGVDKLSAIVQASGFDIDTVISGGAKGVDAAGEAYAIAKDLGLKVLKTDWKMGRGAGMINNRRMADQADALIAVYDGISKGTKNMIELMKQKGKQVYVYNVQA
jgi:hypothetical protein